MKFRPHQEVDRFLWPVFVMDNLLFLLMCLLLAFLGPLYLGLFLMGKRASNERVEVVSGYLEKIYGNVPLLQVICVSVSLIALVIFVFYKLNKQHTYSFETTDGGLDVYSSNLRGREVSVHVPYNQCSMEHRPETDATDELFLLMDLSTEKIVLNTKKNKYWDARIDHVTLIHLFNVLEEAKGV